MKSLMLVAGLAAGLSIAAASVGGQSRFGYGPYDSDGTYRNQNRAYGISPYQNSQYGYGAGRFGYGSSRFGEENATRYGGQYTPFGNQTSTYGSQYNAYGGQVPKDWTPQNPTYNPVAVSTAPAIPVPEKMGAAGQLPRPQVKPPAPATQPVLLPRPSGAKAASTRPAAPE
jgi:hypothetical protein